MAAILEVEDLREIVAARAGRPLLIVDIAVPRDIDPAVGTLAGVKLLDMDDLRAFAEAGTDARKREAYDRFGHAAFQNGGGGADPFGSAGFEGFSEIFSSIFGEFMDPRGQR